MIEWRIAVLMKKRDTVTVVFADLGRRKETWGKKVCATLIVAHKLRATICNTAVAPSEKDDFHAVD